jgi:hypothetical protein
MVRWRDGEMENGEWRMERWRDSLRHYSSIPFSRIKKKRLSH